MSDNNGELKNGSIALKQDFELVQYLLENAELEYFDVEVNLTGERMFQLPNGIHFLFNGNNELIGIDTE